MIIYVLYAIWLCMQNDWYFGMLHHIYMWIVQLLQPNATWKENGVDLLRLDRATCYLVFTDTDSRPNLRPTLEAGSYGSLAHGLYGKFVNSEISASTFMKIINFVHHVTLFYERNFILFIFVLFFFQALCSIIFFKLIRNSLKLFKFIRNFLNLSRNILFLFFMMFKIFFHMYKLFFFIIYVILKNNTM